nr:MAG TPA: hypothetical protein [Caudoviricetes sp.]
MNAVQKIKTQHEEKVWADIEGIMRAVQPILDANAKARWEEEVRKAKAQKKAVRVKGRKAKVNLALSRAGIPLRVL